MPILNFFFTEISGEKKKPLKADMEISHNLKLANLEKSDSKGDFSLLKCSFEFDVKYQDKGTISLKGFLTYTDTKDTVDKIIKQYNKDKKIDDEIKLQLYNHALYRFTIKALDLAQQLQLPPHLKLPTVQVKESK